MSKLIYLFQLYIFLVLLGCGSNNPYSDEEAGKNYFYSTFSGEPKHLDPARAYSSDEYNILAQVYEPLYQYHFLKRPYKLIPLTAETVSEPQAVGNQVVFTIRLKKGIRFQPHAAFAKDQSGKLLYHGVELPAIDHPDELAEKGTRELVAADYIYQVKRLANPQVQCPIFPVLAKYIDGFTDYYKGLQARLAEEREQRRKAGGALYNQQKDEKENPIYIDLRKIPMRGVKLVDRYTFQVILNKPYPQFKYWLAMPFFAPMAWEVDAFYAQPATTRQNIILDRFPVGTGAYMLSVNQPNYRMVLEKNPHYHDEYYPTEGEPADEKNGLLADAGKKLPFIDKAIYVKEVEFIPRWNKFLQGYYDNSGIDSDVFDSAITMSLTGPEVSPELKEKEITLETTAQSSSRYFSFNMTDEVVGTLGIKQRKLRQAISIAFDIEELIQIFANGRGIPAQGPIPPGIFGYEEGSAGVNPVVYTYDEKLKRPVRKPISVAKKLMAEAGYPGGRDASGKQLVLYYDTVQSSSSDNDLFNWIRKQFAKIGIQLQFRTTDYNQFRTKVRKGNYQILGWGWNADYPDPENFLFLLYGPNSKVISQGENAANYRNPEFDRLFLEVANMTNTPARMARIKQMVTILQQDSPWIWGFHPIQYALYHASWYKNAKSLVIGNNSLKYKRIVAEEREKRRDEYNSATIWPLVLILLAVGWVLVSNIRRYRKQDRGLAPA